MTTETKKTAVLILTAGMSTRFGGNVKKQWQMLCDMPVLAHSLSAYQNASCIDEIIVVARDEDKENVTQLARKHNITKLKSIVTGGENRQQSAKNGFQAISDDIKYVAIADGARCLTTKEQIEKVCKAAYENKSCACAGHRCADTLKKCDENNIVSGNISREGVWQVQTPQVVERKLYEKAIANAEKNHLTVTDDESMVTAIGEPVALVECGLANLKITTPPDLALAEAIIKGRK